MKVEDYLIMPNNRPSPPVKHCPFCGSLLVRQPLRNGCMESYADLRKRTYCNKECMKSAFRVNYLKPPKSPDASRCHSRRMVSPGACERCGKPNAKDVHHRDHNPMNNSPENLERICRKCHMKAHNPRGTCSICESPHSSKGFCNKHYHRFKKYGDPLFTRTNVPETKSPPTITPAVLAARAKTKKWEVSSSQLSANQRKARKEQS